MVDVEREANNRLSSLEAWCPGCGLYRLVFNRHRHDCTAKPLKDDQEAKA